MKKFGFVTGIIFSRILVVVEGRRGVDRVSLSRFARWGAVSGLLLSGIFVVGPSGRELVGRVPGVRPAPRHSERGLRCSVARHGQTAERRELRGGCRYA